MSTLYSTLHRYFRMRGTSDVYHDSIRTARHKPITAIEKLVGYGFDHIHSTYESADDAEALYNQGKYIDVDPGLYVDALSSAFFSNHYIRPTITWGTNTSNGRKVELEEFLAATALQRGIPGHNDVFFLIGEMGIGKTTFVGSLISTVLRSYVDQGQVWFIRLDAERNLGNKIDDQDVLVDRLCDKAHQVLAALNTQNARFPISPELLSQLSSATTSRSLRLQQLKKISHALFNAGQPLFLIIDNIDSLVHQYDRSLFYEYPPSNDGKPQIDSLQVASMEMQHFFELFTRGAPLGDLGANILFVTRRDSEPNT